MNNKVLLVVGAEPSSLSMLSKSANWLNQKAIASLSPSTLHLLAFYQGQGEAMKQLVSNTWNGAYVNLDTPQIFRNTDFEVRESIRDFVADLRERLDGIACETGGKRWAKRFGTFWWLTEPTTKNSPGEPYWWELFRAAAINHVLTKTTYTAMALIGSDSLISLGRQLARQYNIPLHSISTTSKISRFIKPLVTRVLGGLTSLITTAMAQRKAQRYMPHIQALAQTTTDHRALAYTWYPRVWTQRFGVWQDMYYGQTVDILRDSHHIPVTWVLRLYDQTKFLDPRTYRNRLNDLTTANRAPGEKAVILEAFGGLNEILRVYLNPSDIFRYWRLSRHHAFRKAFQWGNLDLRYVIEPHLWRSVITSWPHLDLLRKRSSRVAEKLRPKAVLIYTFEFVYGKAITDGTHIGCPSSSIIGIQHGPITPMKLLYAGSPRDRSSLPSGAMATPEPDAYCLDGDLARAILIQTGIPEHSIHVTGPARFDTVWQNTATKAQSNGSNERVSVLVAPGLHDTESVLALTLAALREDSRLNIIVKPHPKVSIDSVLRLVRSSKENGDTAGNGADITVVANADIYAWMHQSDIFVATYSSTSVEAIAFGLPVILLVPTDSPDMSLFRGHSVPVLTASNSMELREQVEILLNYPSKRLGYVSELNPLLVDTFGNTDGRASERVASVCSELIAHAVKDLSQHKDD